MYDILQNRNHDQLREIGSDDIEIYKEEYIYKEKEEV